MHYYAGIDVGGTKCAAILGAVETGGIKILSKEKFETLTEEPYKMLEILSTSLKNQIEKNGLSNDKLLGIGISCGGPLDTEKGLIMSPPNLVKWDNVAIVEYFESEFNVKTVLENDANACAVAEWKFGAGKGTENMVFLTFGTGLGAGIIINGKIYGGRIGMAGEIGHVRITPDGPVGYGKRGSLEGYCSGGGISKLGRMYADEELSKGNDVPLIKYCGGSQNITAKAIAEMADKGDKMCIAIYRKSGEMLGMGLSILIDVLNPDAIVIGSIFARSRHLLWESCDEVLKRECLPASYKHCRVLPSELGDAVGDIAALSVIINDLD